jgi:hypothetical protein
MIPSFKKCRIACGTLYKWPPISFGNPAVPFLPFVAGGDPMRRKRLKNFVKVFKKSVKK